MQLDLILNICQGDQSMINFGIFNDLDIRIVGLQVWKTVEAVVLLLHELFD